MQFCESFETLFLLFYNFLYENFCAKKMLDFNFYIEHLKFFHSDFVDFLTEIDL